MKIAKLLLGIATFTATAAICAVCAGAATYGDYKYTYNDDDTLTITAYNGSETSVDIPSEIKGSRVTAIGNKAFYSNKTIQQVNIPDTVLTIGEQVFYNCDYLNNVKLPENLTSLGYHAFASCDSLYNITLPASLTKIGYAPFDASGLVTVEFEQGSTKICESTCSSAGKLKYVNIPDSVTIIEKGAFSSCSGLEEIIIEVFLIHQEVHQHKFVQSTVGRSGLIINTSRFHICIVQMIVGHILPGRSIYILT